LPKRLFPFALESTKRW